jgi:hypothetical protein
MNFQIAIFFSKTISPLCALDRKLPVVVCLCSCMSSPLYYGVKSWCIITQICLFKRYSIEITFLSVYSHTHTHTEMGGRPGRRKAEMK